MPPFIIIAIVFCAIILARVLHNMRTRTISLRAGIFWMLVWTLPIFFLLSPASSTSISTFMGIGRGVDALFFIAIVILFFVTFRLYILMQKYDQRITKINEIFSQEVHVLKKNNKDAN